MRAPTDRQRQVLKEIREHQVRRGYPISIRELCDAMEMSSTNGIADHLRALERKGLVKREAYRARTLQLTAAGHREVGNGG